jgi:DNA polymerase-1
LPGELAAENLKTRLLLQVHDELVLESPRDELLNAARVVQQVMENAYPISIPLSTEARWGKNWGNLQPIQTYTSAKSDAAL